MSVDFTIAVRHGDALFRAQLFQIHLIHKLTFPDKDCLVGDGFHLLHQMAGKKQDLAFVCPFQNRLTDLIPRQKIDSIESSDLPLPLLLRE